MNDSKKIRWTQTSFGNQVGTVLWAVSTVLLLFMFIQWCAMWSSLGILTKDPKLTGISSGILLILPSFLLYMLLTIGMFVGLNACTAIAKAYGIVTLIMNILWIIASFIAIKLVIEHFFHLDVIQMISGYLESAKSAAAKVDANDLAQYAKMAKAATKKVAEIAKENPEVVNQIKEAAKQAGQTLSDAEILNQLAKSSVAGELSGLGNALGNELAEAGAAISEKWNEFVSDPDVIMVAQAGKKFLSSFFFIVIATPLVQLFTILSGFMLKMTDAKKTRVVSLVLCLFMGLFGGHLLYVKRTGSAVIRIILSLTIILAIVPFILTIADIIKILSGKFNDNEKQPVTAWV